MGLKVSYLFVVFLRGGGVETTPHSSEDNFRLHNNQGKEVSNLGAFIITLYYFGGFLFYNNYSAIYFETLFQLLLMI